MDDDPLDMVGDVLGDHFRIEAFAGEGLLSVVYRGRHAEVDANVAVKCLSLPTTLDAELAKPIIETFQEGCQLHYDLARGNLNIAQTLASGSTVAPRTGATVPYLVREWFEGESLAADLARRRPSREEDESGKPVYVPDPIPPRRSLPEALAMLEHVADGLSYAHDRGICHLALRPSNVFLAVAEGKRRSKILDFGLGRALDQANEKLPTPRTQILYPHYAAPEQLVRTLGEPGPPSDVYAMALLLLEILRDRPVVDEPDVQKAVLAVLDRDLRPTPQRLGISLPAAVAKVLERALSLDPAERHPNARALWSALRAAELGEGLRIRPTLANPRKTKALNERLRTFRRRAAEVPPAATAATPAPSATPTRAAFPSEAGTGRTAVMSIPPPAIELEFGDAKVARTEPPADVAEAIAREQSAAPPPVAAKSDELDLGWADPEETPEPSAEVDDAPPQAPPAPVRPRTITQLGFAAPERLAAPIAASPAPPRPDTAPPALASSPPELASSPPVAPAPTASSNIFQEDEITKNFRDGAPTPAALDEAARQSVAPAFRSLFSVRRSDRPPPYRPKRWSSKPPATGAPPPPRSAASGPKLPVSHPPEDLEHVEAQSNQPTIPAPPLLPEEARRGHEPDDVPTPFASLDGLDISPVAPSSGSIPKAPLVPSLATDEPTVPVSAQVTKRAIQAIPTPLQTDFTRELAAEIRRQAEESARNDPAAVVPAPAKPSTSSEPTQRRVPATSPRRWPIVAGIAACVLIGLGVVGFIQKVNAKPDPASGHPAGAASTATAASAPPKTATTPSTSAAASAPASASTTAPAVDPTVTHPPGSAPRYQMRTARAALDRVAQTLPSCRTDKKGLWGTGGATVKWSPDGKVAEIALGPPYRTAKEGECVTAILSRADMGPFEGKMVPVSYEFFLPRVVPK